MAKPYDIRVVVIDNLAWYPITASIDCNYWSVRPPADCHIRSVANDANTEDDLPAGIQEALTSSQPPLGVSGASPQPQPPRYKQGETVVFIKSQGTTMSVVARFVLLVCLCCLPLRAWAQQETPSGQHVQKVDLSATGGVAPSATNPVPTRETDGTAFLGSLTGASVGTERGYATRPVITQRVGTGALTVVCAAANIDACTAGSTVELVVDGYQSAAATFANGDTAGTLTIDFTTNGTHWVQGVFVINASSGTAPTPSGGKDLQVTVAAATTFVDCSPVFPGGSVKIRARLQARTAGTTITATFGANMNTDVFGLGLGQAKTGTSAVGAFTTIVGGGDGTTNCTIIGVGTECAQNISIRNTALLGSERAVVTRDLAHQVWSCTLTVGNTTTQCKAAPGATLRLYVTDVHFQSTTATASTFRLKYGTGVDCATGITNLTGVYINPANTANPASEHWTGANALAPANNAVCVTGTDATNTVFAIVSGYTAP